MDHEKNIPCWNLNDLYPGMESEAIKEDIEKADTLATEFAQRYEGELSSLSARQFAESILLCADMKDILGKIMSYGYLLHASDGTDENIARFFQYLQETVTGISSKILFYTLEINKLPNETIEKWLDDPQVKTYQPWIEKIRLYQPHMLSDNVEKTLHEKSLTSENAWVRLFDEIFALMRFEVQDQKDLPLAAVLDFLMSKDGNLRYAAAKSLSHELKKQKHFTVFITNTLALDKQMEDKWRGYKTPVSSMNLSNQIEDEIIETLVGTVKEHWPSLSHRYYALKAKWLGKEKIPYWDRNAPLPFQKEQKWSWQEASTTVLDAFENFDPRMSDIGKLFFDNHWIDAETRLGKCSGAFSHGTVPSAHPYILLNWHGKTRDIMTLAHELGHGIHQKLAAKQGPLLAPVPLTLAETASVFSEMLTFQKIFSQEKDIIQKRGLLAGKVEDMLNTVARQIAFFEFEHRLHTKRQKIELSEEDIGNIWMEVQYESLGDAITFDEDYRIWWSYIPHFIHTPFYVYAYAFGDCLVNSLYNVYQQGEKGFQDKYIALLEAGGTLKHTELLKPFGLSAADSFFWKKGLSIIEGFIDQLEKME